MKYSLTMYSKYNLINIIIGIAEPVAIKVKSFLFSSITQNQNTLSNKNNKRDANSLV